MTRYDTRLRVYALQLAMLAGFVDVAGFVLTQGLFVSFMTGNSTRLSVGAADGSTIAVAAGALIASFLVGVVLGSLIAAAAGTRRKPAVMACVTVLLTGAATLHAFGFAMPAALLLAVAMGAINNVFLSDGEVSIAITYMTGTLVRLGQRLAAWIQGDRSGQWLPYFWLWASLMAGAVGSAFVATYSIDLCLWLASLAAALLTLRAWGLAVRTEPRTP